MNQITQMYRCVARIHILVWFLWGGSSNWGSPRNNKGFTKLSWKNWMMTGGTPHFRKTPQNDPKMIPKLHTWMIYNDVSCIHLVTVRAFLALQTQALQSSLASFDDEKASRCQRGKSHIYPILGFLSILYMFICLCHKPKQEKATNKHRRRQRYVWIERARMKNEQ